MSEMSEHFRDLREIKNEQKQRYQEKGVPRDLKILDSLEKTGMLAFRVENDGSGGKKYVIEVNTPRGFRTVYWWTSTGKWNVKGGKACGYGLFSMGRYFQLIPKGEKRERHQDEQQIQEENT